MKGRTYRYFQGEPLFPFGYGLSYTTFGYRKLECPESAKAGQDVALTVEVRNTGKMAGEEVVQAYVKHDNVRSLAGFQRVMLRPGERKLVKLVLPAASTARRWRSPDRGGRTAARRQARMY